MINSPYFSEISYKMSMQTKVMVILALEQVEFLHDNQLIPQLRMLSLHHKVRSYNFCYHLVMTEI